MKKYWHVIYYHGTSLQDNTEMKMLTVENTKLSRLRNLLLGPSTYVWLFYPTN
jgi:hypothetical protein